MNPHDAQEKAVVVEEIEDFESVLDRRYGLGGHPNLVTGLDEDLPLELAQVLLLSVQTRNAAGGPVPDHDREEGPSPSTLTSSSGPTTSDDTVSPALQHLDTGASQAQDPPLPPHPTAPSEAWANDPGATRVPGRSLALPERRGRGRPRLPEEERVARIHASNRHAQARYRARQAAEVETMTWHLSRLRLAMAAARAEAAVLASERGALEHLLRAQDTFAETLLSAAQLPSHVIPPCRYDNPALSACQNAIMHGYCHLPRTGSRLATLAPAEAAQFCALSVEVLAERYAYNWMAVRDLFAQPGRDQSRAQFSMLIHAASIKGSAFHWRVVHYRHNVYNQVNSLVMMGDPVIQLSLMMEIMPNRHQGMQLVKLARALRWKLRETLVARAQLIQRMDRLRAAEEGRPVQIAGQEARQMSELLRCLQAGVVEERHIYCHALHVVFLHILTAWQRLLMLLILTRRGPPDIAKLLAEWEQGCGLVQPGTPVTEEEANTTWYELCGGYDNPNVMCQAHLATYANIKKPS